MATGQKETRDFVLKSLSGADPALRALIDARMDLMGLYLRAAQRGDAGAKTVAGPDAA